MTDDPNSICYIKCVDNIVIGFANTALRFDYVEGCQLSPFTYLQGIFVEKSYRKNYYGKELV
ncbi:MAG: hypothetical protein E7L04_05960 [Anaerococcus sp.]|uniref:GNAT family N-acetyltransferase n=1 Tax=Anaerococcus sp. TaxID=1872515 RepID=UPI002913C3F2|nr:hypothetical protein [Anaerococcus sp.]